MIYITAADYYFVDEVKNFCLAFPNSRNCSQV